MSATGSTITNMKFSKEEVNQVTWGQTMLTPCPYCNARDRDYCRNKKTGITVYLFHKARKNAFLASRFFIISEELDFADL